MNLITYKYTQVYSGDQIKKNEMGGAHRMNGGWKRCVEGFGGETWGKETTVETKAPMTGYYSGP